MHTDNKVVGKIGEDLAANLLKEKGYQIVDRNWGNKWGEIDIIARLKGVTVFVEVKTKVGENFGPPEEMVNPRKLRQIQRMASLYNKVGSNQKRIDIVAVVLNEDLSVNRINHYECVY
jgi:putative endonuclease